MEQAERSKKINRIALFFAIINGALLSLKLSVGLIYHSAALVSDAIHSLTDIFSALILFIGAQLSKKSADKDHPFGHEKYESIGGIFLSAILIVTALFILFNAIENAAAILGGSAGGEVFGAPPLIIALLSIVIKEALYQYAHKTARMLNSPVLRAEAWHQRLDALTSVASLLGVAGALLGFPLADPLASLAIALVALKISIGILVKSIRQVTDKALAPETLRQLSAAVEDVEGVARVDSIQSRAHANLFCLDIRVSVDRRMTVEQAHKICRNIKRAVCSQWGYIKSCIVHVNPY